MQWHQQGGDLIDWLKINFQKSNLYGIGVNDDILKSWANRIHCKIGSLPSIYLGLLLGVGQALLKIWKPVIDQVETKLEGWKLKLLSRGGQIILLKLVISSLLVFFMSIFKMPQGVKEELEKIQRHFLWVGGNSTGGIHYITWDTVSNYKEEGGFDLIDLEVKNQALLTKWIWMY
ncbi:Uncharacterized protein TCM_018478 [Theobroma cacao]|uniref:Uncharacterized protein n=1 Tax=Theobroma cacao TaxID=3641 RepID=A0A061EGA2_THECC|nr:Uncharacterized protein TCM_018478 [Theobroma cacao]